MANDTTIVTPFAPGNSIYTQIDNPLNAIWNGSAYVTAVAADWATYATSSPETPAGMGRYICQFPTSSPAGFYTWRVYLRVGATPAASDPCVGGGTDYWDGTTFGNVGSVAGNIGGNVVGSVASVVGNIGGNVVGNVAGSVASVVAPVDATITDKTGFSLAPDGIDSIILEPAAGSQPEINARQGLCLVFNAAPGGIQTNVPSANPQIWNPAGTVLRATLTVDSQNNRTGIVFNNLPS